MLDSGYAKSHLEQVTRACSQADDGVGVAVEHLLDEQLLDLLVVLVHGDDGARASGQNEPWVRADTSQDLMWQLEMG